jgi:uncharacterized protein (DUF736 family)
MNIGSIKQNDAGIFVGKIATLAIAMTVALREVHSANPKAPKFEVLALSASRAWVQVGALFELFSNGTGEAFLNGKIEGACRRCPAPTRPPAPPPRAPRPASASPPPNMPSVASPRKAVAASASSAVPRPPIRPKPPTRPPDAIHLPDAAPSLRARPLAGSASHAARRALFLFGR